MLLDLRETYEKIKQENEWSEKRNETKRDETRRDEMRRDETRGVDIFYTREYLFWLIFIDDDRSAAGFIFLYLLSCL